MPRIDVIAVGTVTTRIKEGIPVAVSGVLDLNFKTNAGIDGKILVGPAAALKIIERLSNKVVSVRRRNILVTLHQGSDKSQRGQPVRVEFPQAEIGFGVVAAVIRENGQPVCGVNAVIPQEGIDLLVGKKTGGDILLYEK